MARYIEEDDDGNYREVGENYEYVETPDGYDLYVVDDDGTEYTESERYGGGGGGCALAALALPGAGAALLTLSWLFEHAV
ncbi:hypothetical protein ACWGPQ_22030 [Saccharomonospora azurea]